MDRRLFLVLGLSLIVALVISSVFYFQVVGRSAPKKDANVKEVVIAAKQLDVGVTIKPGDVRLRKGDSRTISPRAHLPRSRK